jgi:hypothetical protein
MSDKKDRLIGLRAMLTDLEKAVPPRHLDFHRERDELRGEVGRALERFALLLKRSDVQALEQRGAELRALADGLAPLFADVDRVERRRKVLLEQAARDLSDAQVGDWLRGRCEVVHKVLRTIGVHTLAPRELDSERSSLARVEDEVARLERALTLYLEAEQRLGEIRSEVRLAALRADLPGLRERLQTQGADGEWIADLSSLLEPLRAWVSRGEPPELNELGGLIRGLIAWRNLLGVDCPECDQLFTEYNRRAQRWAAYDDDTFAELGEQAVPLRQRLHEHAARQRSAWLGELENQSALLRELGERDTELERALAALREDEPADAGGHQRWHLRYKDADARFWALVGNRAREIEERFDALRAQCEHTLAAIEAMPRYDETDEVLDALREELASERGAADNRALLIAIQDLRGLRGRIGALEQRCKADLAALEERRSALSERYRRLRELTEALDTGCALDLAGLDPDAGSAQPMAPGLDRASRRIDDAYRRLAQAEGELIGRCAARTAELHAWIERANVLVPVQARIPAGEIAALFAEPAGDLESLEPGLRRVTSLRSRAEALLSAEAERRAAERRALIAQIADIDPARVGPMHALPLSRIAEELGRWQGESYADDLERMEALRDLLGRAGLALALVNGEEEKVRNLRRRLHERFSRFVSALPDPASLGWAERVEALIAPMEGVRRPLRAELAQLREADGLLDAMTAHSRRRVAAKVADDLSELRRHLRSPADPEAEDLLQQFAALPDYEPPGHELRLVLEQLMLARRGEG